MRISYVLMLNKKNITFCFDIAAVFFFFLSFFFVVDFFLHQGETKAFSSSFFFFCDLHSSHQSAQIWEANDNENLSAAIKSIVDHLRRICRTIMRRISIWITNEKLRSYRSNCNLLNDIPWQMSIKRERFLNVISISKSAASELIYPQLSNYQPVKSFFSWLNNFRKNENKCSSSKYWLVLDRKKARLSTVPIDIDFLSTSIFVDESLSKMARSMKY